jgi:hypothetical protein
MNKHKGKEHTYLEKYACTKKHFLHVVATTFKKNENTIKRLKTRKNGK